ncbi:response regulator transcription factor [Cupriavidus neocaledonicus]|uniref:Two component transcriptional regulator, LuxR family n=1 Tax=Cupriavidus neocaledonicus TaxID=1040979 RepID=A0A375H4M2_9BURK|nr:response regulator transcription factor [Cupriavidus neocaledonicus]SOZ34928.1 Two componenttranscriptional regulator LuxR family [Cupriavidus neocaledonicus]SPD46871.1 Two component transcriptional regulator, LuxR family [Cupriavidus neocaledonicus]
MPPRTFSVVIADDHPVIQLAVKSTLSAIPDLHVCATCSSGKELFAALATHRPDLIVTDFTMGRAEGNDDGLRLMQRLRQSSPATPVVVFTMLTNGGLLTRIRETGVAAIVGKNEDPAVLRQICLDALAGHRQRLSPALAGLMASAGALADGAASPLSPREIEVVRMFAAGSTVTAIAAYLHRSLATVATQKRSAMRKLNITSNADLVAYAREHGLA